MPNKSIIETQKENLIRMPLLLATLTTCTRLLLMIYAQLETESTKPVYPGERQHRRRDAKSEDQSRPGSDDDGEDDVLAVDDNENANDDGDDDNEDDHDDDVLCERQSLWLYNKKTIDIKLKKQTSQTTKQKRKEKNFTIPERGDGIV